LSVGIPLPVSRSLRIFVQTPPQQLSNQSARAPATRTTLAFKNRRNRLGERIAEEGDARARVNSSVSSSQRRIGEGTSHALREVACHVLNSSIQPMRVAY
jgi:hypothetical protein